MTAKDAIKNTIEMGHMVLTTYIGDLGDADLMVRAVDGTNHIAWQLGHLVASEHQMLTDAGFDMPDLPDGFAESHSKESSSSNDQAKFLTKEKYLTWMDKMRAATMANLDAIADTDLDKATPESMRDYAPTKGAAFNIIGMHVMMHAAQFIAVRRKLGKPVLI